MPPAYLPAPGWGQGFLRHCTSSLLASASIPTCTPSHTCTCTGLLIPWNSAAGKGAAELPPMGAGGGMGGVLDQREAGEGRQGEGRLDQIILASFHQLVVWIIMEEQNVSMLLAECACFSRKDSVEQRAGHSSRIWQARSLNPICWWPWTSGCLPHRCSA